MSEGFTEVGCLVAPSETAPSITEMKLALLTYDTVWVHTKEDRDIVPPIFEITGPRIPLLPLGSIPTFSQAYDEFWDQITPALDQGCIRIATPKVIAPHKAQSGLGDGVEYPMPPFEIVFDFQSELGTWSIAPQVLQNSTLMGAAKAGLVNLAPEKVGQIRDWFVYGKGFEQLWEVGLLPPPNTASAVIENLAAARLLCTLRAVSEASSNGCHLLTADSGIEHILGTIRTSTDYAPLFPILPDAAHFAATLARLHKQLLQVQLDTRSLERLSMPDVLELREKVWGEERAARRSYLAALHKLAVECPTEADLSKALQAQVDALRAAERERNSSLLKLGLGVGAAAVGSAGALAAITIAPTLPGIYAAIAVVASVTGKVIKDNLEQGVDAWRKQRDLNHSSAFAVVRPYRTLLPK